MSGVTELRVLLEDKNEVITLRLTSQQAARASADNEYLQQLVNRAELEKFSMQNTNKIHMTEESQWTSSSSCEEDNENSRSLFIWTTPCVQLLLNLYEDHQDDFTKGINRHKKIWEEIAFRMQQVEPSYTMTGSQCQSLLSGLKKTFKKIIDHNNASGNDKMTWPFFDKMNEIFWFDWLGRTQSTSNRSGSHFMCVFYHTGDRKLLQVLCQAKPK